MISSEVQRTLVKSPPELWAELSDPDSLARHLGELGEIKITRSEPEKLVEWEAAGTTGKVAIKASGWGTRVTLTVERELPEALVEPEVIAEPELDAEAPDDAAEPEPEPEAAQAPEAFASEETQEGLEPAAAADSVPAAADSVPAAADSVGPAPATEAARRAARLKAPEPPTEVSARADSPEPRRRGFFARLFGGRRKRSEAEAQRPPVAADASPAAVEEDPLAEQPTGDLPSPSSEALPAEAPPAAETVAGEEAPAALEPAATETDLDDETDVELAPQEEPRASETLPALAETPTEAQAVEEQPAAAESLAEPELEPAQDIAAELAAAEESATAEVTAILTGVLDRLGAAHHRPFSRA